MHIERAIDYLELCNAAQSRQPEIGIVRLLPVFLPHRSCEKPVPLFRTMF